VRRAARRRVVAVLAAAAVTLWVVARVDAADRARREWGATSTVLVVTRDLAAGATIGAGDVRADRWPTALVPDGALTELPAGRRLSAEVTRGEAVVEHRLARPGAGGWAAVLEPGEAAVRLPLSGPMSGIVAGDRVDVLAPGAPPDSVEQNGVGSGMGGATVVADDARVLEVHGDSLVVAVRRTQSSATAGAALGGLVAVVVRP
jgi:pilus assembly protein CpaB